jgi:hypothetical protein
MSMWHCETNEASLHQGAQVLVASDHSVVRIQTADQMTIETSNRDRLMAVVIERAGDHLVLGLPDGTTFRMEIASDHALEFPQPSKPFSSQSWKVISPTETIAAPN